MFTRTFKVVPVALLLSCGGPPQPQAAEGAQRIDCAIGPGSRFENACLVERVKRDEETILVVRHPDGGFRRLVQLGDGRGLEAADGADVVIAQLTDGGMLEVAVGAERYRFPAREMSRE